MRASLPKEKIGWKLRNGSERILTLCWGAGYGEANFLTDRPAVPMNDVYPTGGLT